MKVTVCFGSVRVLVPCGSGELLVRDLIAEATRRYRNATGKGAESWIVVRNLRSETGGILDPDDQLKDVADDRETLVATLEGRHDSHLHHGGDGASGSSVGTASPDLFRGGNGLGVGADTCGVEVEVGNSGDIVTNGLQVRRGSEPTLNQDNIPLNAPTMAASKRWSAAVVFRDMNNTHTLNENPDLQSKDKQIPVHDNTKLHPHTGQPFQRQSNRLSMQFSGPGSGAWIDAAERIQVSNTKSLPRDTARKEPLGQDTSVVNTQNHRVEDMLRWVSGVNNNFPQIHNQERPLDRLTEVPVTNNNTVENTNTGVEISVGESGSSRYGQLITVPLIKGERGLGFTITTRDNPTGGICPIYIKNILPKGAAVTDGRLRAGDRMVSVNGVSVGGLSQQQVVTLLRNTQIHSTVTIVVERPHTASVLTVSSVQNRTQRVEPQLNYNKYKDANDSNSSKKSVGKDETGSGRVSSIVNAINQNHNSSMRNHVKKSSSKDDLLHKDQMNKSDQSLQDALNSSNTVLGLRHRSVMQLDIPVHDSEKAGLGISVKGKVTVGSNPQDLGIFIKSVLNGGAASRDGRLHTNDQLLNINGVSLVGQSNAEAMETLRRALVHTRSNVQGSISLTIARRTESMDSIARWKDDTPPNVNDTINSNGNSLSHSRSFSPAQNTVIYNSNSPHKPINSNLSKEQNKSIVVLDSNFNKSTQVDSNSNKLADIHNNNTSSNSKKHSSIVNINNNNTTWINDKVEENRNFHERDKIRETNERDTKRDSFEWRRLEEWNPVINRLTSLRNESYCIATQGDTSMINGGREHVSRAMHPPNSLRHNNIRSPPPQHNVIIEEDYGSNKSGPSGVWESGSESGCGNDAIAFSRDAVGRRSMSEKRHAAMDAKNTGTYKKLKEQRNANNAAPVGPSLGMRKSSSLESLQTAIQEVSLHGHHMRQNDPLYGRAHQPLKHWLTDNGVDGIVRGTPTQSSLTHKKPSLLKSLSSMLGFGKQRPKVTEARSEIYSSIQNRSHPGRASEKSLSRSDHSERLNQETSKTPDSNNTNESISQARRNDQSTTHNGTHSRQSSVDRLVDGEDRMHGNRPMPWAPPYRHPPSRTSPSNHTVSQVMEGPWGGDHYVNYEEIQQNLNARRERLSEVQIGQMRRQVHAQRVKAEEERRGGVGGYHSQRGSRGETYRPQSNFYEYESIQHARPINTKLAPYH